MFVEIETCPSLFFKPQRGDMLLLTEFIKGWLKQGDLLNVGVVVLI